MVLLFEGVHEGGIGVSFPYQQGQGWRPGATGRKAERRKRGKDQPQELHGYFDLPRDRFTGAVLDKPLALPLGLRDYSRGRVWAASSRPSEEEP